MEDDGPIRISLRPPSRTNELAAFVREFNMNTSFNPLTRDTRVWENEVSVGITTFDGYVVLNFISTMNDRGKGYAGKCLSWLCDLADKHGVPMRLSAVALGSITMKGVRRLSTKQLEQWYERHGFKNASNGDMIRKPEKWPTG